MIKTFLFGIFLGLAGTVALLHYVPAVDLYREASLIAFEANVGNSEVFQVNLPHDRILAGIHGQGNPTPANLQWPDDNIFAGSQAEFFKVRDRNDAVVGVASRISSTRAPSRGVIQWMLHLPARGTMFVLLGQVPAADGSRRGILRGGTGDFAKLGGVITERFIADVQDSDSDAEARIQLVTRLVGPQVEDE